MTLSAAVAFPSFAGRSPDDNDISLAMWLKRDTPLLSVNLPNINRH
jgi:hypothetical protein